MSYTDYYYNAYLKSLIINNDIADEIKIKLIKEKLSDIKITEPIIFDFLKENNITIRFDNLIENLQLKYFVYYKKFYYKQNEEFYAKLLDTEQNLSYINWNQIMIKDIKVIDKLYEKKYIDYNYLNKFRITERINFIKYQNNIDWHNIRGNIPIYLIDKYFNLINKKVLKFEKIFKENYEIYKSIIFKMFDINCIKNKNILISYDLFLELKNKYISSNPCFKCIYFNDANEYDKLITDINNFKYILIIANNIKIRTNKIFREYFITNYKGNNIVRYKFLFKNYDDYSDEIIINNIKKFIYNDDIHYFIYKLNPSLEVCLKIKLSLVMKNRFGIKDAFNYITKFDKNDLNIDIINSVQSVNEENDSRILIYTKTRLNLMQLTNTFKNININNDKILYHNIPYEVFKNNIAHNYNINIDNNNKKKSNEYILKNFLQSMINGTNKKKKIRNLLNYKINEKNIYKLVKNIIDNGYRPGYKLFKYLFKYYNSYTYMNKIINLIGHKNEALSNKKFYKLISQYCDISYENISKYKKLLSKKLIKKNDKIFLTEEKAKIIKISPRLNTLLNKVKKLKDVRFKFIF